MNNRLIQREFIEPPSTEEKSYDAKETPADCRIVPTSFTLKETVLTVV